MLAHRALQPILSNGPQGNDAYTKLLLHCNGADTSTVFADSSNANRTVTATGNAQVDVDQFFFPSQGSSLLLDGTGDYLSIPDSPDWDFPGDFAIDFRIRGASFGDNCCIGNYLDAVTGWAISIRSSGTLLRFFWGDTVIMSNSWTPATGVKYHVAVCRHNTTMRMFIDGVQLGSPQVDATDFSGSTAILAVGRVGAVNGQYVDGHMGEVRIRKGNPGWMQNFIPPRRPYL